MEKNSITIRLSEAAIAEYVAALQVVIDTLQGQALTPAASFAHWRIDALRARLANAASRSSKTRDRRAGATDAVRVLTLQVLRELAGDRRHGGLYALPAIFAALQEIDVDIDVETFHTALLELEKLGKIQLNVANDPKPINKTVALLRHGEWVYYVIPRSPEAGESAR